MNRFARALLCASAMATTMPSHADTLREALQKAYAGNPTLTRARASQRANDENIPINRARALPNASIGGSFNNEIYTSSPSPFQAERSINAQLNVSVPIYAGGGIKNGLRAAEARVAAGQADLRDVEASVFAQVVAAYMDVVRDQAIVSLNSANVGVLRVNLEATRDRFQIGDLTRTDVAQSQARLAIAQSQLEGAQAQLINSRENYLRLVGEPPVNLEPPPPLPNLPDSPQVAVSVAIDNNPALQAARRQREASKFDVGVVRSQRLPRVSAVGSGNYSNLLGSLGNLQANTNKSASVGIQASIPLFQGGGAGAQVRQAQARESAAIEGLTEVERGIVAQTRAAYASWRASNQNIVSSQSAVDANTLSLEGVRAENSVGNRSILDILNAEQELLNAQVQLVAARRNAYVAGFSLLAAMGKAESRDLGLEGGPLYDPVTNYRRVKSKIWDWSDDPQPSPISKGTVDSQPQTPAIIGPVLP